MHSRAFHPSAVALAFLFACGATETPGPQGSAGAESARTGSGSGGRENSGAAANSGLAGGPSGPGGSLGASGSGAGGGGTGAGAPSDSAGSTSVAGSSAGAADSGAAGAGTAGSSGAGSGGASSETDPAPGKYGTRANLQVANSEMAVAEAGGKIYVLGGYPSSRVTQSTVQVYDPKTDSWDYVAELPFAVHHPVAVGHAGKVYSLGGQTDDGDTSRTLVYDPALDSWEELAPMPTARGAGAGAIIGDSIYVVGGRPPSAGNAFEVYDVGTDTWTELPDLPQQFPDRNHLAAAAIHGKIYVAGGRYNSGSFTGPLTDSLDVYDPAQMSWSSGAPMLRPRGGVNGIAANGCFFVWGGEGSGIGEPNDVFPDMDVYDPVNDRWTALPPLPTPVHGVTGAAFLEGLIYIPGGGTQSGGTSGSTLFQVYRPNMTCQPTR